MRWLLVAALAACSDPDPERFRVEVPILDHHRSLILGVELESTLTAHALAISPDTRTIDPLDVRFPLDGELALTALLYERELDDLDLSPGILVPERDPAQQRALPDADRIERLTIRDGDPSAWSEADLPPALADLRITAIERCGTFESNVLSIGVAAPPVFTLALDDRWVLVATNTRLLPGESPTVAFVDAGGNVARQSGLPSSFFDGYREQDGTIWLGGEGGVVYRATFTASPEPRLTAVATTTVSSREDIVSLVGPPNGAPPEQFALTTDRGADEQWGAFEWYDGTTWRVPGLRRNTPHDATWVAPGYALFASFYREGLLYGIRDGAEIEIMVDSIVFGSILEIEQMPGLGLVAGSSGGEVHLQPENGEWSLIANVITEQINGLHPYPEGIVFLSGDNMIRYVHEGIVCDQNVIDRFDLSFQRSLTVLGEDVIVPLFDPTAGEDALGEQFIAWFKRARP